MDIDGINQLVNDMEKESKAIKSELFKMCWYMRGGMTISEAYMTDSKDREIIAKLVEENLATTKETQLPFF
jgi:hypothetical protein